jgi:uncharacterized protein YeaO (DUF488 family)
MVTIKRAYEASGSDDGTRVLIDRVWPRGVRKQKAQIQTWMRDLAPSNELRRFFGHDPKRWQDFHKRYLEELKRSEAQPLLQELLAIARKGKLTLVYGARDQEHNQAVVLKELLDSQL